MSGATNPTALIVADAHFHLKPDPAEQRRLEAFLAFLEAAHRADDLVLLGDIFDFWFDYAHFRLKGYDELLAALDRVAAAGCRLHFIGGNHDIWAAGYLHERYGTSRDGGTAVLELGGRRVLACHGDGLLSYDWAYSAFRALVRARAGVLLAKSLHPELLYTLATWLSGRSRAADRDEAVRIEAKARTWLERQRDPAWDLAIIGHVHHAFRIDAGPRTFCALAGWLGTLGYAVLQDGQLRLADFAAEPRPLG